MNNSAMLAFPYSVVVLLAILRISSGDNQQPIRDNLEKEEDYSVGGPATRPQPSPNHNLLPQCVPQYLVIPQNYAYGGSIFANVPSVTLFANTFLDAVHRTDILRELLDLSSQTATKQYCEYLSQFVESFYTAKGIENAAAIGEFVIRAIKQYFDILPFPVLARMYCNSAAQFLFVNGDLGLHNAEDLALVYAQTMADAAKDYMNSEPTSKFLALVLGFVKFYDSLGYMKNTKAPLASYYFGNECFVAAATYRWL